MLSNEEGGHGGCEKFTVERSPPASESSQSSMDFFGPALPPHLLKKSTDNQEDSGKIYGPVLPECLSKDGKELLEVTPSNSSEKDEILIGPALPEHLRRDLSESEEPGELSPCNTDDSFGPSADLMATPDSASSYKFLSAQKLSKKEIPEDSGVKRETWMTELPEKRRANFGLLPRHFKSQLQTDKDGDDSVWTDTPADKSRKHTSKKDDKEILKMKRLLERDREMEKLAKKAAKKLRKKESLLEMHLKNMKKKKKKEMKKKEKEGKTVPERRPFDRNIDLQIRKFDENQRRAILNKSQLLNDRFAPGQSKFL